MSDIPDHILKALEWWKEWSSWLVAIQAGLIGGILTLRAKEAMLPIDIKKPGVLKCAVYLFGFSILVASFTLGGFPAIAQGLTPGTADVLALKWSMWGLDVELGNMLVLQHGVCLAGIVLMICGVRFDLNNHLRTSS